MAYKRSSAYLAIGQCSVENEHAGHSIRHRLRVCVGARGICVLPIPSSKIIIAKMATINNLKYPNQLQRSHWRFWQPPGKTLVL